MGRTTRVIAMLAVVAGFGLTACGGNGGNPPPPSSSVPAAPAAPADLMIGSVSMNAAVADFKKVTSTQDYDVDYDVKYVKVGDDSVKCPVSEETVNGDGVQMLLCGDLKTFVVPEKVNFGSNPPKAGVVFFVAQQLAYALPGYNQNGFFDCVAGYVTHRASTSAFTTESFPQLKTYLYGIKDGVDMYAGAVRGINLSLKTQPMSECQSGVRSHDLIVD